MKKPYIKKYVKISNFVVWIVDGKYIRKNLDEEFTNFGQHYRFHYIPRNEFWIDKQYGNGDERKFFIDHMLIENRLMASGKNYSDAIRVADKMEMQERGKSKLIRDEQKKRSNKELLIRKIHKRKIKTYSKTVTVWIVNGKQVRDLLFIDFTEGGHDKVYPFVPDKEIWIDDDIGPEERKFVLLHEIHERNLMAKGWPYSVNKGKHSLHKSAHTSASRIEYFCRHHPSKVDEMLKKEIEKSEAMYAKKKK